MIRVKDLTYNYQQGRPPAVKGVNVEIGEAQYTALIGPNGCGKSTLIKHFNALLLPAEGEVLVDDLNTREPANHREIRRRVGMVFQNPDHQIVGMSVEEDVAFGPGNLGYPAGELRRRVDQALEAVGLKGFETRMPHTLSGGEKQLLAMAGLLAMEPRIIVLDEPGSSLDPAGKRRIMTLIQKLRTRGMGIIHVTHNMEEAALAERVLVMERGELVADGSPAEVLSRVDWLKSLGLAPPRMSELLWRLREKGEDLSPAVFSIDEAFDEIVALLERIRQGGNARVWRPV